MKIVLFHHAFSSCWDHSNAHFMRGVARTLARRGHTVVVYEAAGQRRRRDDEIDLSAGGGAPMPGVTVRSYHLPALDLDQALHRADVVIAHAWIDPRLIRRLGKRRIAGGTFRLLFHDTHSQATAAGEADGFALDGFDAILAGGEILREAYLSRGWGRRVITWHEAADTSLFKPHAGVDQDTDLIWIGNWSDGLFDRDFNRFLVQPVASLGLRARLHGVGASRYAQLDGHDISFEDWLPDHRMPAALARARAAIDIPHPSRRRTLPGVPTTSMFEALACGMPLISAPWDDAEGLFHAGSHLTVADGEEAAAAMRLLMDDRDLAADMACIGLCSIQARHTCEHRVDEFMTLLSSLTALASPTAAKGRAPSQRPPDSRWIVAP